MILNELLVPEKHAVFTVNRYDKLGSYCFRHNPNVFLRSMTANVYESSFLFNDIRATFVDVSNHARNHAFVARNYAGGKHNRIALFNHEPFVALRRHLGQCCSRLTLRTCYQKHDFVIAHLFRLIERNQQAIRNVEITQPVCDLYILLHGATQYANTSIKLLRDVEDNLESVN